MYTVVNLWLSNVNALSALHPPIGSAAASVEATSDLFVFGATLAFAVLIGLSRLYLQRHHLSDVIAGFALGPLEYATCALLHQWFSTNWSLS